MSEKYIRENPSSYTINKNSKSYGKFKTLEDAIYAREMLMAYDWDLTRIPEINKRDGHYIITKVIDGKIHLLGEYTQKPTLDEIEAKTKKYLRNPNNSRYGLNITKIFETFIIKKQIAGDDYIFGYYDNLEDASFVRNHLLDHNWDITTFSKIMHDDESDKYKVTTIIDDRVYVIDTYDAQDEINLEKSYRKFLSKIAKHKYGLASHPYLDELTDMIDELEELYNVQAEDENWNLSNIHDPLSDVIFNLTPWQKTLYDSINDSTFDEIKKSLIRYRSKNFDEKIRKNLDELIELELITKKEDKYFKKV